MKPHPLSNSAGPTSSLRKAWRTMRWAAVGAGALAVWACSTQPLETPKPDVVGIDHRVFQQAVNRQLDLVFMVDNSSSMAPLQVNMTKNLPDFMNILKDPATGGLPDVHIGVVSSDLGAGRSAVRQCATGGGDRGVFHNDPLNPRAMCPTPSGDPMDPNNKSGKYIIDSINPDGSRVTNFPADADITNVFSCIALLGDQGCGFESQFGSVLTALNTTQVPQGNEGFLRPDAYLAIVMLTNEDDCTVPPDSDLFNPNMSSPADPYGALQSYRCTEFGIECDSPGLPHQAPASSLTLRNCHSKEDGRLMKVADFVAQLKQTKSDPTKILFAAISALQTTGTGDPGSGLDAVRDLTIGSQTIQTSSGTANAPVLNHVPGCEMYAGDAALRIWDAVVAFNGVFESICQNNYAQAMSHIANTINKKLQPSCITGNIANNAAGNPNCHVVDRTFGANNMFSDKTLPYCGDPGAGTPCWKLDTSEKCPANSHQLVVDRGGAQPSSAVKAVADCEVCFPGSTTCMM